MSPRILRLILRARLLSIRSELAGVRKKSRLMLAVLGTFCIGYLVAGYYIFHSALVFLHRFPVVGSLLAQRMLYLVFGFFFAMLIFSNAIIGYAGLFKNRETNFFAVAADPCSGGVSLEAAGIAGAGELGAPLPERADDGGMGAGE